MAESVIAPQPFEVSLARKLDSLSSSLLATFLKLDVDRDGCVTRSDLRIAVHNSFGIDLTPQQVNAIFIRFATFEVENPDRKDDGIRYQEFVKYIDVTARSRLSVVVNRDGSSLLDTKASSYNDLMPIVISPEQEVAQNRQQLLKLLKSYSKTESSGGMAYTNLFLQMDTQRSGRVTPTDFRDWINSKIGTSLVTLEILEETMGAEYYRSDGMTISECVSFVLHLEESATQPLGTNRESWGEEPHMGFHDLEEQAKGHFHEALQDCVDNSRSDLEIAKVIADQLFQKRVKLVDAFRRYDVDGTGKLDGQELCKALNEAGLHVSVERAQSLVDKFDLDGDGKLNKGEFVRLIAASSEPQRETGREEAAQPSNPDLRKSLMDSVERQSARHDEIANRLDKEDVEVLLMFRSALEEERMQSRKLFSKMDKDGSHSLTKEELSDGFEAMGLNVSEEHLSHIMNRFETEGTGRMQYYQFVKLISSNLDHELDS